MTTALARNATFNTAVNNKYVVIVIVDGTPIAEIFKDWLDKTCGE